MSEYPTLTAFIVALIFIFNCPHSDETIIHFGSCPLVIGERCDSNLVRLYLYNRINRNKPTFVVFNDDGTDNLTASTYNPRLKSKVIIHGYNSDMNLNLLQNLKDEYLTSNNYNIWMVNYPDLSKEPCYGFAVYNIRYVGKCVAYFIKTLKFSSKYDLDIHVIGFSLGGQVPNFIAKNLPFKLPRITGLDPALPLFYTNILHQRLDSSDAQFVDVIHTNALFQGQIIACGHVDFYVNGGVFQPGCTGSGRFNCYHGRAVEYFAESINTSVGFWGWNCASFIDYLEGKCEPKEPLKLMGEYVDPGSPGIYLVNTASKRPYALGKNITTGDSNNANPQDNSVESTIKNLAVTSPYSNFIKEYYKK
ncbi:pancreatic lipase-related protein 2-like [Rhodnius prolixus]|uniref:Putative pancreatic lipase-like enzyme n=2 Tax=Rhodnius TaxID=13248 RepID=R4G4Y6_RHOPR